MKLPGFYLLDAIAKNVYDPYAAVFSRIVVSLFVDTYFQVDSNTRGKMEEMLLTWRTAGPSHTEIFGSDNQTQLQTAVWGDQVRNLYTFSCQYLYFSVDRIERPGSRRTAIYLGTDGARNASKSP
jgi:pre-mRNA cleavage complex 2 protein Pcf11